MNNKATIVTVTYNSENNLNYFINNLYNNLDYIDNIIFVDNASKDNTLELINSIKIEKNIIKNSKNIGYSAAINQGIKKGLEENKKYILVTNNDLVFEKGIIKEMIELAEESESDAMGVFGYNDINKNYFSGFNYKESILKLIDFTKFSEKDFNFLINKGIKYFPCDFPSGHFILFNKSFFEKVGFYDNNLFFSGDETDLAIRSNKNNNIKNYVSTISTKKIDHITKANRKFSLIKNKYYIFGYNYILSKQYKMTNYKFWLKSLYFMISIINDRPNKIVILIYFYISTIFKLFFNKS